MVLIFLIPRRAVSPLASAHRDARCRYAFQLLATQLKDLFVTSQRIPHRSSTRRSSAYVGSPPLNSTICFLLHYAPLRIAANRGSYHHPSTTRSATLPFVCYYATNSAPQLFVSRYLSAPLCTSPLCAPCRNSTICLLQRFVPSSQYTSPPIIAPHRSSTQRFVCYSAALRPSAPRYSPCLDAPRLIASFHALAQHFSTLLNDLFVTSQLYATWRSLPHRFVLHRNSTLPFVCYYAAPLCSVPRHSARLPQRTSATRNSTQRFVYYSASLLYSAPCYAPPRSATLRGLWHRCDLRLSATQRYHLFITTRLYATRRSVARLGAALLGTARRNASFRIVSPRTTSLRNSTN